MEMLKMEQLDDLKLAIKEAEKDDTPYIGIKDDELHILGDPNKTEVKAADYVIDRMTQNNGVLKDDSHGDGGLFHGIFFRSSISHQGEWVR